MKVFLKHQVNWNRVYGAIYGAIYDKITRSLITFAFRSSEVRHLLINSDPYVALNHWECLIFFLREN